MFDQWENYLREHDSEGYRELLSLSEKDRAEAFDIPLVFGTGGLRGVMGIGPGRINRYTIARVSRGLAGTILAKNAPKTCVIGYDTRNHSSELASVAAGVLCACGIQTFLFERPMPTPMVSHAVRSLQAGWGVVVTASHNPKKYNGYKVYDSRGVQILPDLADIVSARINEVEMFSAEPMSLNKARETGLLQNLGEAQTVRFLSDTAAQLPEVPFNKDFPIVYSALYGTGAVPVPAMLQKIGFTQVTAIQTSPDGNFGGLRLPNPESPDVYAKALQTAQIHGAKLLLATDPDCDRVGVHAWHKDGFVPLNGNQIGALLCDFLLSHTKNLTGDDYIVTTVVSGDMGERIADSYGVRTLRTLTGFKYIGDVAERESRGRFLMGYEESYGYLTGNAARDKDGVLASAPLKKMESAALR